MRFATERALVLYTRPFKDKDEWVTFFTRDRGKHSALAFGTKSLTSRFRGVLEPLTIVDVGFAETDHYCNVREAKKCRDYGSIGMHLGTTYHAFYLLELLHHVLPESTPEPELFQLLLEVLACIEGARKPALVTMYFAVQMFTRLGHVPAFAFCSACGTKLVEQQGFMAFAESSFMCGTCCTALHTEEIPFRAVKVLHFLQTQPLRTVLALRLDDPELRFLQGFFDDVFRHVTSRQMQAHVLRA